MYASLIDEQGNQQMALSELREPTVRYSHRDTFRLAFHIGFASSVFLLTIVSFVYPWFNYSDVRMRNVTHDI